MTELVAASARFWAGWQWAVLERVTEEALTPEAGDGARLLAVAAPRQLEIPGGQ